MRGVTGRDALQQAGIRVHAVTAPTDAVGASRKRAIKTNATRLVAVWERMISREMLEEHRCLLDQREALGGCDVLNTSSEPRVVSQPGAQPPGMRWPHFVGSRLSITENSGVTRRECGYTR